MITDEARDQENTDSEEGATFPIELTTRSKAAEPDRSRGHPVMMDSSCERISAAQPQSAAEQPEVNLSEVDQTEVTNCVFRAR